MTSSDTIRLYGTVGDSIVDGPGLRYSVFVQGCTHGCPGCHNPESQPCSGGTVRRIADVVGEVAANKLIGGVTITGGEPFEQAAACAKLAQCCRDLGLGIWVYTGYRYEDLAAHAAAGAGKAVAPCLRALSAVDADGARDLLDAADVLVDGPFVQGLKTLGLAWRGSSNQRLIDLPATRAAGHLVPWEAHDAFPEKPPSW